MNIEIKDRLVNSGRPIDIGVERDDDVMELHFIGLPKGAATFSFQRDGEEKKQEFLVHDDLVPVRLVMTKHPTLAQCQLTVEQAAGGTWHSLPFTVTVSAGLTGDTQAVEQAAPGLVEELTRAAQKMNAAVENAKAFKESLGVSGLDVELVLTGDEPFFGGAMPGNGTTYKMVGILGATPAAKDSELVHNLGIDGVNVYFHDRTMGKYTGLTGGRPTQKMTMKGPDGKEMTVYGSVPDGPGVTIGFYWSGNAVANALHPGTAAYLKKRYQEGNPLKVWYRSTKYVAKNDISPADLPGGELARMQLVLSSVLEEIKTLKSGTTPVNPDPAPVNPGTTSGEQTTTPVATDDEIRDFLGL